MAIHLPRAGLPDGFLEAPLHIPINTPGPGANAPPRPGRGAELLSCASWGAGDPPGAPGARASRSGWLPELAPARRGHLADRLGGARFHASPLTGGQLVLLSSQPPSLASLLMPWPRPLCWGCQEGGIHFHGSRAVPPRVWVAAGSSKSQGKTHLTLLLSLGN